MPRRRITAVSRKERAYCRAHILEALREDVVVCLECGRLYVGLVNHLPLHGLIGQAYREKRGYNRRTGLITPVVHGRLSQQAFERNHSGLGSTDAIQEALASRQGRQPDAHPEAWVRNRAAMQARFAATTDRQGVDDP